VLLYGGIGAAIVGIVVFIRKRKKGKASGFDDKPIVRD